MPALHPAEATSIDDEDQDEVSWTRVADELATHRWGGESAPNMWLSTATTDGRVHPTGVGSLWLDDGFWFTRGTDTRKSGLRRPTPGAPSRSPPASARAPNARQRVAEATLAADRAQVDTGHADASRAGRGGR